MTPVKSLTFTTLYPNAIQPRHGIFVETRLRHLVASGDVVTRVVAPVPWFPTTHQAFGRYADLARVPPKEVRHGIEIVHPRFPLIPKVGMTVAPGLLAAAMLPVLQRVIHEGYDFDVLDAHYFYPDGVAAAWLAERLHKPLVITARGTDLNLIPQHFLPRKMIQWAAEKAGAMITVCQALKETLIQLGVNADKVTVLRNGVNLQLFHPINREEMRRRLGLNHITLLSVGHLIERKGHDIAIRALTELPQTRLIIAGDGEEEGALRQLSAALGVAERVVFLGALPQDKLAHYYGAVDALVLASSREGWANVLLEAMACGTPVIASNVWGTPEVVAAPEAGILMPERTPRGLVLAFNALFANYPAHEATRLYAERFSWDDTTTGQKELFARVAGRQAKSSMA